MKSETNLNTPLYRILALLLFGLLLVKINGVIYRTVRDNQCARGDQRACKVAASWGLRIQAQSVSDWDSAHDKAHCEIDLGCTWLPHGSGGVCICG